MQKNLPVQTRTWRNSVIFLGLLAAAFTAVYKAMDNITVHNFITSPDSLTQAFAYLIIGGWTGVFISLAFALLLGKRLIDPAFNGFVFNNRKMHRQAFISGFISAGGTLFTLLGNQFGDPSALVALASAMLVYTIIYDVATKQVKFSVVAVPFFGAMIGSALAAYSGSVAFTLAGIFYVLVVSNGLGAISEITEQSGARASDGVNFFIWRFFWLATTGTVLAIVASAVRGYSGLLTDTIVNGLRYLPFIMVTMFFVFLGIGLRFTLKKTNAVSVVMLLSSAQIILAFPITILGNLVHPGLFGGVPESLVVWAIRIAGAITLAWSIYRLRKVQFVIEHPKG